jgi:hypothetical protein
VVDRLLEVSIICNNYPETDITVERLRKLKESDGGGRLLCFLRGNCSSL